MRAVYNPLILLLLTLAPAAGGAAAPQGGTAPVNNPVTPRVERAVFGVGCFWCAEAIFQRIDGVVSVRPGYAGGSVADPTYEQVCSGTTGHAECAEIVFDPAKVGFAQLLDTFWHAHDPTSLNRQGADVGTQYRSAVFYMDEAQRLAAERSKAAAQAQFDKPIVTEIVPLKAFYPAEDYHRQYYERHKDASYCQFVIAPKLRKLGLDGKAPVTGR
jgi:peptide-methionine (S)-S-oxide reductase